MRKGCQCKKWLVNQKKKKIDVVPTHHCTNKSGKTKYGGR